MFARAVSQTSYVPPGHHTEGSGPAVSPHKILLVDDNQMVLDVTADYLRAQGYEVAVAHDGTEALHVLGEVLPDLIVSDIMMPGMDGYAFYQSVTEQPEWCNIPFLFLSALGTNKDIHTGKELGCDDYLVKPFEPTELVATIKGKLARAKRRDAVSRSYIDDYRKRVINTLSHEFRTPLVAINTGSELLLDQHDSLQADRVKSLLQSIHRGGQRLQRLVNDFMALQQIDSGTAENAARRLRRAASISDILEMALDAEREQLGEDCPQIHLNIPDGAGSWMIQVYESQVTDVVCRLLSNAIKFGGVGLPVEVGLRETSDSVELWIRDHGPGLSCEDASRACQMFMQIDRERFEQQGCGVGLAIAQYFVDLNSGSLTFRTPSGGGLEVSLSFTRA